MKTMRKGKEKKREDIRMKQYMSEGCTLYKLEVFFA